MTKELTLPQLKGDVLLLRLAREIAIDQFPLERVLETNGVSDDEFSRIQKDPRFLKYLEAELSSWNSAMNTTERVRIKSSAMIEEWLSEAFRQMHNEKEALSSRTELAKLIARLGGMDKGPVGVEGGGERFSVTINLGADSQLSFDKQVTSKVIEGETV